MKLIPHIVIWAILTTIVIFLAIYRRRIDVKSDDMLHVLDTETQLAVEQVVVAKKIETIDRWGKLLTILAALYLLAIGGLYLYNILTDTSIKIS